MQLWKRASPGRFWEIDFVRGIAVLMMVCFHSLFDLDFFGGFAFNLSSGFWWGFARATASIFLLLVGVGLSISFSRSKARGFAFVARKFLLRGASIFAAGMVVTLATFLFLGNRGTIWFGVLHLIGVAIILSVLFVSRPLLSLLAGILFIAGGLVVENVVVQTPLLVWLGLKFQGFYTYDYFPLFPWLGVVLAGIFIGSVLYPEGKRKIFFGEPKSIFKNLLCGAGRNSLLVYFFHQPILIAMILVLTRAGIK